MQYDGTATKRDLEELNQDLSAKIEASAVKIDANAAKIDANAEKIDANAAAISRVAAKVVENSEKLTRLTTKVDKFDGYFNRIMTTLDGLVADFARFDQERTATNSRFNRVEFDVGKNKRDIKEIKTERAMP